MSLIRWAYVIYANDHFNPFGSVPVRGGPAWIESERCEINAKPESPQSRVVMNGAMLRALLEDRFKLRTHRETREVPIYTLTTAKGGPRLQPSKARSCIPLDFDNPPQLPEPARELPLFCGLARASAGGFDLAGVTMADFCRTIAVYLDRNVIDRTGSSGMFDIHLNLSAADLGQRERRPDDLADPGTADPADIAAAVRVAICKLGLRLDSSQGQGQFLIIDHVEKPSEN